MLTTVNQWTPGRRWGFDVERERKAFPDIIESDFWALAERYWDFTVCGPSALYQVYGALNYIDRACIAGAVVECGVYLGGTVMFAADILKRQGSLRKLYALDTFGGFVSRVDADRDYQGNDVCAPGGRDFTEQASENMRSVGYDHLRIVKGDVAQTIPQLPPEPIALLRLDTDTYETTKLELELLHPRVVRGGVVIIDDYGFNQGCAEAVREFIAKKPDAFTDQHGRSWPMAAPAVFPMRQDRYGRSWVKVD